MEKQCRKEFGISGPSSLADNVTTGLKFYLGLVLKNLSFETKFQKL